MDEGFWVSINDLIAAADKLKVDINIVFDLFGFEEDAGKIRIHTVRSKSRIVETFLAELGRGIDLRLLPTQSPRHERLNWGLSERMVCNVCNEKTDLAIKLAVMSNAAHICVDCASEMVIFYEMEKEKEKRDSRAAQIRPEMWKGALDWPGIANEGAIRNEGV